MSAGECQSTCTCTPYAVCAACAAYGYESGLAGYMLRMAAILPPAEIAALVSDYGEVLACSPRTAGWHVHTSACVVFRRDAGPRCVHCGEMTVQTELGRAHMVSGLFWCAGQRVTSATPAGEWPHDRDGFGPAGDVHEIGCSCDDCAFWCDGNLPTVTS